MVGNAFRYGALTEARLRPVAAEALAGFGGLEPAYVRGTAGGNEREEGFFVPRLRSGLRMTEGAARLRPAVAKAMAGYGGEHDGEEWFFAPRLRSGLRMTTARPGKPVLR